jgi:hypothetical protein
MANLLPGMKTYIGIAITLIGTLAGAFHWDWWNLVSADATQGANMVVDFVGLVIAAYGRAVAKPSA